MRRVDLWPDDWLAGIGNLSLAARGVYLTACLLIYSRGGPIGRDHLRRMCPSKSRGFIPALDELLGAGKLLPLDGDLLDQRRCEIEIERAKGRIAASQAGAAKRWAADDGAVPLNGPLMDAKRSLNGQLAAGKLNEIIDRPDASLAESKSNSVIFKNLNSYLGSACAPAREEPPEPTDADKTHVDRIVADMLDVLKLPPSGLRNGVHNADAYREAIGATKRDQWLNNLAEFVGEAYDGVPERMAAWEAIEQARAAGSRAATPPDVRRALDKLSQLREAHVAQGEAAE